MQFPRRAWTVVLAVVYRTSSRGKGGAMALEQSEGWYARCSTDAELVYLLERISALAADRRETIAAGQRILHFLLTPGAIVAST
jgi:hypothetical protein